MSFFDKLKIGAMSLFGNVDQPKALSGRFGGGRSVSGQKYPGGVSYSGQPLVINHKNMRTNARAKYYDSTTARAMVDRRADTVADRGLRLESMPDINILGITAEAAEKWASNVESRFELFANAKEQNRSEQMTFNSSQALYQKTDELDGENFIRLYYSKDKELISPLQFEFFDTNQIRGQAFTNTNYQMKLDDGITRNEKGVETAYKIWYINESGEYIDKTIPRMGSRSKRVFMLHGMVPDMPGQQRGYSHIGHVIQEFELLTNFDLSQINKAIHQSQLVFTTKNKTQDPSNPLEAAPRGVSTGILATDGDCDPLLAEPTQAEIEWCGTPIAEFNQPGSTVVGNLIQGDELEAVKQTAPSIGYAEFVDAFTSTLASSRGMPLEILKMKFQNNYSASRAALVLYWRVAMVRRDEMIMSFNNPVYKMWLSEEIGAGRIIAPGWTDPVTKAAWLKCEWYGSPMPNIDPYKEAKANKENLEINATTIDRASRDTNGSNGSANIAKNKRSFDEMPVPPWARPDPVADPLIEDD